MKNYKVKILVGILIVLIVVCIGITYAWLTTTLDGEKEYVLKAGTLNCFVRSSTIGIVPFQDKFAAFSMVPLK